jgi:hypothetical protein
MSKPMSPHPRLLLEGVGDAYDTAVLRGELHGTGSTEAPPRKCARYRPHAVVEQRGEWTLLIDNGSTESREQHSLSSVKRLLSCRQRHRYRIGRAQGHFVVPCTRRVDEQRAAEHQRYKKRQQQPERCERRLQRRDGSHTPTLPIPRAGRVNIE